MIFRFMFKKEAPSVPTHPPTAHPKKHLHYVRGPNSHLLIPCRI